ncbi:MAG: glycosyltransferase family 2 protein [Anaerolineales bacterium]|nr:glycosyltransferase family 2 protein [Anaerolineales bacterium]
MNDPVEHRFLYPPEKGLISACIVTRNAQESLQCYLDSLLMSVGGTSNLEIIVVDNESTDGTEQMLKENFPKATYVYKSPGIGITKGINTAIESARGEFILIATPSTEIIGDAIPNLRAYLLKHEQAGVVGPKVLNPDGSTQFSSKKMPDPKVALRHTLYLFGLIRADEMLNKYFLYNYDLDEPLEVTSLTMSLMLARRAVFEEVGFLDNDLFVWASDVDWCYKVEKSRWKQYFLPNVKVYHRRNSVSKKQPYANLLHYHRDLRTFYKKHFAERNSWVFNLIWELLLQMRLLLQVIRYLIMKNDDYSYY